MLEVLKPQLDSAWEVVRNWPLGKPTMDMTALVVLKVIAVTSRQLSDIGVYGKLERRATGVRDDLMERAYANGPDDCGFF
jgi:hypothetical protein